MSLIAIGLRRTGRVDQVPSICHVETTFVLIGVPVAPLIGRSWLTDQRTGEVMPIPLSVKSVFFAYARMVLWALAISSVVLALLSVIAIQGGDPEWTNWFLASAPAVAGLAIWASYRVTRAGPQRAAELQGRLAGAEPLA